jgi:pyruvate,water dikinase
MRFSSGATAIKEKNKILKTSRNNISEIKGLGATGGVARGRVKICSGYEEALKKIRIGDILVTGMTLPDCVPAMRKAAAIVTDEGGITCHAAIVSRELGKVCVVGTKIATQVFKDGDMVEVDANKGTIKKLN